MPVYIYLETLCGHTDLASFSELSHIPLSEFIHLTVRLFIIHCGIYLSNLLLTYTLQKFHFLYSISVNTLVHFHLSSFIG